MAKIQQITRVKNSVRDDAPVIAIGKNRYYLSDLMDKHLHAGMDVQVFTTAGDVRTIKKGEWLGKLFSYVMVFGAPALMFHPSDGYFGKKSYFVRYYGVDMIDDKLLRYNYRLNKWIIAAAKALIIVTFPMASNVFNGYDPSKTLPTTNESDKKADDLDKKTDELDKRDASIDAFFASFKKPVYLGAAILAAYKALSSDKQAEQLIFGGIAAYAAYEGLKEGEKKPSIGRVNLKSKFVPIYKSLAYKDLGWRAETNIKFAQNKPGCYIIKRNGIVVYVGASANVYRKSLRHFQPYKPDKEGSKQDYYKDYEQNDYKIRIVLTNTPKQAYKLEAALIQKYQPRDNYILNPHLDFSQNQVDEAIDEYDFVEVEAPF